MITLQDRPIFGKNGRMTTTLTVVLTSIYYFFAMKILRLFFIDPKVLYYSKRYLKDCIFYV